MKIIPRFVLFLVLAVLPSFLHAEAWPTLEKYVSDCEVIILAQHVGLISPENAALEFKVIETWKGRFNPENFKNKTPENYITATDGQHGVRITEKGQRIIFFFTRHNQPKDIFISHSTAFPVSQGFLTYASTGELVPAQKFAEKDFKRRILDIVASEPHKKTVEQAHRPKLGSISSPMSKSSGSSSTYPIASVQPASGCRD